MVELEEIDVKILKHLLNDGRKSFSAIAKECHSTTDIISKHFIKMKKTGIIVGATIQKNFPLFGYKTPTTILVNVESQHLEEILIHLKRIPRITPFRQYNSAYNVGIITMTADLKALNSLKDLLKKQLQVTASKIYLWVDVRNIPENLSFGFTQTINCSFTEKKPQEEYDKAGNVKLDETDLQIVEELTKDGRAPFSKIAQSIGSSTDTVNRRYVRLLQNGFIKVSIQVDPILLGYRAAVSFFIDFLYQNEIEKAIETLSKLPDVSYLVRLNGDCDLLVLFLAKDIEDICKANKEIMRIPDIGRIESSIRELPACWPRPNQHISTV